jgi:hypothetical protein
VKGLEETLAAGSQAESRRDSLPREGDQERRGEGESEEEARGKESPPRLFFSQ